MALMRIISIGSVARPIDHWVEKVVEDILHLDLLHFNSVSQCAPLPIIGRGWFIDGRAQKRLFSRKIVFKLGHKQINSCESWIYNYFICSGNHLYRTQAMLFISSQSHSIYTKSVRTSQAPIKTILEFLEWEPDECDARSHWRMLDLPHKKETASFKHFVIDVRWSNWHVMPIPGPIANRHE